MAEDIRMDSHKLIYHPETMARWLRGENIYPIEMEIGLTNACNHRCIFCAVDYTGYRPNMIDRGILTGNLEELAGKGTKSVIYAGEGEPQEKITDYFMNMDLEKNCRELCRLDEMNRYLDLLKNPGAHVNFI